MRIEDYALIGNTRSAALLGRDGSIDWLCLPRFDSPACFARLLGDADNGRWLIGPTGGSHAVRRVYRPKTLIVESEFESATGRVRLIDFMPESRTEKRAEVVRIVEGLAGTVEMRQEMVLRFDYGRSVPWVRKLRGGILGLAGPNAVVLRSPVELRGERLRTVSRFPVKAGERLPFSLTWFPSGNRVPVGPSPERSLAATTRYWEGWTAQASAEGEWGEPVTRSLITLKALTYAPSGGVVAAPTTSLPEAIGGVRNWDYRYCWLRDATFTLYALIISGFDAEAVRWCHWLERAVAGVPAQAQIMYGVDGERLLPESELDWLAGYEGSAPVRIGNAAHGQRQLDVYGEVMDVFHVARSHGIRLDRHTWAVQRELLRFLETAWEQPDQGFWESRGEPQHYTHSRVMSWVAFDRGVKAVERFGLKGPVARWRKIRSAIHAQVCELGFDARRNTFVQAYGHGHLDAALLMIPLVGFLPADDPRVAGTLEAIRQDLMVDGFVQRYLPGKASDGVPGSEAAFLPCSFWFADNLALMGRRDEARELFEQLLKVRSDLGLLAEEYSPASRRQLGNFPQGLSHVALINTAQNLLRPLQPPHTDSCASTFCATAGPAACRAQS